MKRKEEGKGWRVDSKFSKGSNQAEEVKEKRGWPLNIHDAKTSRQRFFFLFSNESEMYVNWRKIIETGSSK